MIIADPFSEIAAVLVVASCVGAIFLWLRQPLIIAFILVGIVLGPAGLDWVHALDHVDLFAKLGIGLLLFVVGLKLDPHLIRSVGPVAVAAGVTQMAVTATVGYALSLALGMSSTTSFYVAAALTFSSTIIIVKLLSDKRQIDTLHGRISLGILIMQDIVVVALMIGLSAFGAGQSETTIGAQALQVIGKGIGFLTLVALTTRFVLPNLLAWMAKRAELMTLFAIAWAIGLASIGTSLGFSKEVGAFVAGVALATTPYKAVLAGKLIGLRDFLLLFFFIDLGVHIDVGHLWSALGPAIVLSAVVLIGKPVLISVVIGAMGYSQRTAVTAGLAMGQISEFSLILAAMGVSFGHIEPPILGLITLIGLITIGLSSYMISYDEWFYARISPLIKKFRIGRHATGEINNKLGVPAEEHIDVIVFGLGRYGRNLAVELHERGEKVLGVDFDPERVRFWREKGLTTFYGDLEDDELFHSLPLNDAKWVVSTVANVDKSAMLLHALQHNGFNGRIAIAADSYQHSDFLVSLGADVVLLPFRDAALDAADRLLLLSGER